MFRHSDSNSFLELSYSYYEKTFVVTILSEIYFRQHFERAYVSTQCLIQESLSRESVN